MKETMKEVVIIGPKQFEVREVPVPKPADNEVLIQMKAAGVCGSDVHQFLGENPNAVFPRVPGHENAGVIVAVGKDVKNIKVGDHVVVDLVVACGECPQCKKGRRNVCRTVKARGSAIDGGWREYFAVPEHEVYLLPQDMPFKDAALIEPFAIGGHCTTRAGIQGGESVLVLGSGTIGAVILQTLKLKGCRVICDYAHTPDGLEQLLRTYRPLVKGKLWLLFGCGGDRDRAKRPLMGRTAARYADRIVLTSDNPRTEDPMSIIEEILPGVRAGKAPYKVICDRPEAIRWAIDHHEPGDVILLCGKGHEDYQIIGHEKIHMDEREIVADYLAERAKRT